MGRARSAPGLDLRFGTSTGPRKNFTGAGSHQAFSQHPALIQPPPGTHPVRPGCAVTLGSSKGASRLLLDGRGLMIITAHLAAQKVSAKFGCGPPQAAPIFWLRSSCSKKKAGSGLAPRNRPGAINPAARLPQRPARPRRDGNSARYSTAAGDPTEAELPGYCRRGAAPRSRTGGAENEE